MFNETGEKIYILVSGDERNIENEAERSKINMQLELGASDLESLQPCDSKLRPFRLLAKPKVLDGILYRLGKSYELMFSGGKTDSERYDEDLD